MTENLPPGPPSPPQPPPPRKAGPTSVRGSDVFLGFTLSLFLVVVAVAVFIGLGAAVSAINPVYGEVGGFFAFATLLAVLVGLGGIALWGNRRARRGIALGVVIFGASAILLIATCFGIVIASFQ